MARITRTARVGESCDLHRKPLVLDPDDSTGAFVICSFGDLGCRYRTAR